MLSEKEPIVRLEGVSKAYGKAQALHPLDLSIAPGEFVTFLGPSGCGKSTTLRILGGFEKTDTGRIILEGQDVTAQPPEKRKVNMVFQDYALFPHMTVAQNISFGLELKGLSKAEIKRRLDEVMSFLELGPFASRYASQLSGGQRQRVALARALAPDPALLLLDEPLGALDAKLRTQVQMELKSIQRRTDKTFLFVTHDQDEALTMSDRIVVMNGGRIEQDGTPEDLYFRPETRFVAEFIGATNLLDGTVRGVDNASKEIVVDWRGIELRGRAPAEVPGTGQEVSASLRLEKIRLAAEKPLTGNAVMGRIVDRTFLGSRVAVDILVEEAGAARLRAYTDTDTTMKLGDSMVWLGWDSASLSVLRQ
ncbi:spermidine/putrescine ABC transporter ATP-binding protein [Alloyangia pacifica]|uniref:Spermidine/putrescine ABC transporter ATP-binding protein n=1 Tax=Alloyangia pacifica TaxID=311180 RepID=A0A2U8HB12_9RHOB|nr:MULTISPECIES: ABC transporter ATP-binding protein [Roseobacteraceae]AWI82903.1 spermidine/putrescine ABC transporter ATP-binding protein [Alloyangia pacifica]NDV49062.1 ABC transporter ATP-binding protein [Salipiger sp. PrR003]NDW31321.1 ABC transporter ATP-binding protein [Salipiger sp. PrR007]